MFDSGLVKICSLQQTNGNGGMPKFSLVEICTAFYQERTVGVTRMYAALGANVHIDMLIRIWENREVLTDMYCVLENGDQYKITQIQHLRDDNGLKVSDLTLERVNSYYDVD